VAGAVLHSPAGAQVRDTVRRRDTTIVVPVPPRADSVLRDSLAKKGPPPERRDSIKAPLAHSETPTDISIARKVSWSRDSLFATGSLTVADLLERVTGLSTFHSGWIGAPMNAAYLGDFRRVRVFIDGMEIRELDPRAHGVLDLTQISLWAAENATIEQEAEETRLYIQTWRTRLTTPITRTDIATGDQQTNLYRGFLGRRWDNGAAFQFGAQQFGTTPPSVFGNASDQLGLITRLGWANARYSIDAFASRISRHRGVVIGDGFGDSIPSVESARVDAYVRAAVGDPDASRAWAQIIASASRYNYVGQRTFNIASPKTPLDSARAFSSLDTATSRSQYILSAGSVNGPLKVSASARFFSGFGTTLTAPAFRASYTLPRLTLSAFGEGKTIDSTSRFDATMRVTPLSFVSVLASVGRTAQEINKDTTYGTTYVRAEAGLRLRNVWFLGGVLRRDSVQLAAPKIYDTLFTQRWDGSATGVTAAIRGQVWRLIHADVWAVRWNDSTGFYRPRYQTRSELFVRTNLLDRFPSNNFGFQFSAVHEYRSSVRFPVGRVAFLEAPGYRTVSTLLEIRILSATLSWQFRNLLGERYTEVPFFVAPRQTNFYGVRWEFLN
jgi:hypothetical protein